MDEIVEARGAELGFAFSRMTGQNDGQGGLGGLDPPGKHRRELGISLVGGAEHDDRRTRCQGGRGSFLHRREASLAINLKSSDRKKTTGEISAGLVLLRRTNPGEEHPGALARAHAKIVAGAAHGFKSLRPAEWPERGRGRAGVALLR